jgi:hypothetical protein
VAGPPLRRAADASQQRERQQVPLAITRRY